MLLKKGPGLLVAASLLFAFAACSVSEEAVMTSADDTFEAKMKADPGETNYENDYLSIYKPGHLSVEDEDLYNLVLSDDDTTYLIFSGDAGEFENEEELLEAQRIQGEPDYVQLHHENGNRGYLIIQEMDEVEYQVIAGYNGVKGTAISTLGDVNEDAELLFEMVQSVQTK
ncbi:MULTISPECIES: hypothetical protein [Alteribacter]|uniref:DUF4367 domain-containing protein n=1 Tax=Alteribacter keqinensis TaxID=2483800 RepID=A0A3M7TYP8_9BACI|nr:MULTISPECIES: hypothetical protein [Alteribacter]MBM7096393.1 hypothetical protein [Alteribacter salitolerans]RNA70389.1 hypothetical protein EBO34_10825 [Alteribacter keqinensis]